MWGRAVRSSSMLSRVSRSSSRSPPSLDLDGSSSRSSSASRTRVRPPRRASLSSLTSRAGKGLIMDSSQELVSPTGEVYARMVVRPLPPPVPHPARADPHTQSSGYAFGNYKAGGFNKSIAPKQPYTALSKPPTRAPDVVFSEKTTEEQAILYRLSGDYNPLHIFPDIGRKLGFPGAILHGICSYGTSFFPSARSRSELTTNNRPRGACDRPQGCRRGWFSSRVHERTLHLVRPLFFTLCDGSLTSWEQARHARRRARDEHVVLGRTCWTPRRLHPEDQGEWKGVPWRRCRFH